MIPAVTTTDVIDRSRVNTLWWASELYSSTKTTGYMPNPDDLIVYPGKKYLLLVETVDYDNYTYTTVAFNSEEVNGDAGVDQSLPVRDNSLVVYVDSTQYPATLSICNGIKYSGSNVSCVRVFRGTDVTDSGEVISGYMKNGALASNTIPLKTISYEESDTVVKIPLKGICTAEVSHGEACTIVCYGAEGEVEQIDYSSIYKTNLVMASETPSREIKDIRLKSPFLSGDNSKLLLLPINLPLDDLVVSAVIEYTDGSKEVTIDGSRVILNGLRNSVDNDTYYIASNAGQTLPLTLSYKLATGETYTGDGATDGMIFRDYTATTQAVDGAYSLKLFVVPYWAGTLQGYRLKYYLYNLTRGNLYDATAYVEYVTGSATYSPLLYNVKQTLNVQLDISKVNSKFKGYVFSQSFNLTLKTAGTKTDTNFEIDYVHDGLTYGTGVYAKFDYDNVSYTTLDVSCGFSTQAEWLAALFTNSYPLYDRRSEDAAPTPTHFTIVVGSKTYTYPISQWADQLQIEYTVEESDSLVIRWTQRNTTTTLELGLSPMLCHEAELN